MTIFEIIKFIILTEALTELLVKSEIFKPLRAYFFNGRKNNKIFDFIHSVLDCGYCTSVWIGCFLSTFFILLGFEYTIINVFIFGLIIHRMSNVLHNMIDRFNKIYND